MKQQKFMIILAITGIVTVITLSSFFKIQQEPNQFQNTQPSNEINSESSSNDKISKRKNNLTLSTAFENDYYTRNHRTGHFYAELVSDQYINERPQHVPLNLSIVIDRSGSMAGEKIRNAKLAAKFIVDQMSPEDFLSIVIYDNSVDILQSSVQVYNKQLIKNKIEGIYDRGGTNLMGGTMAGYSEVKRNYRSNYVNRVLLLSDGLANEGITDPNRIEEIVRSKNRIDGISISTFGVGRDYNEDLMTAMAESGTGNYYFIDNAEKISGIFQKELNGLNEVIAQNATLKITIPEYINIDRVYGQRFEQTGRVLTIRFQDIFSAETKGLLIKYTAQSGRNTTINFQSELSFYDPIDERNLAINLVNKTDYTSSESLYESSFNNWVATQVAVYESNEQLEKAMKEVDRGNYDEAKKIVQQNKVYIESKPKAVREAPIMQAPATINADYESKIENVENMASEDIKFLQKDVKSSNYKVRAKKK